MTQRSEYESTPSLRICHEITSPVVAEVSMSSHRQRDMSEEPSSPEDGSNFRRSLQIDMKGLVGSAVGNVSSNPHEASPQERSAPGMNRSDAF